MGVIYRAIGNKEIILKKTKINSWCWLGWEWKNNWKKRILKNK